MDCEIRNLCDKMQNEETIHHGTLTVTKGELFSHSVILAKSGVGKVNSAMNTQYIIDKFMPDIIINTGVAGGLALDLKVGDVVVATSLVQHDFDASAFGYAKGYICNGIEPDKPTLFHSNKALIETLERAIPDLHKGIIATGDTFVASKEKKQEIIELFGASAVEMEGASVAQVASANNIPFIVIRAISDLADGTKMGTQNDFEKTMAKISSDTVEILLKTI